jgi:hypothetical protein
MCNFFILFYLFIFCFKKERKEIKSDDQLERWSERASGAFVEVWGLGLGYVRDKDFQIRMRRPITWYW